MALNTNKSSRLNPNDLRNDEFYDAEVVSLASDYSPLDDFGNPTVGHGILVCTTAGAVKIQTLAGHAVVLTNLAVGTLYPIAFTKIFSASTTAVGLVAFH